MHQQRLLIAREKAPVLGGEVRKATLLRRRERQIVTALLDEAQWRSGRSERPSASGPER